jgi:dihydroorotate dehydrogenase electron transfer subunit
VIQRSAAVIENVRVARDTYRIRLDCPDLAAAIRPGQFLMLRLSGVNDPLLGRPFALYDTVLDTHGQPFAVDVVYLIVGKMTGRLAGIRSGDRIDIWGPLGNGFANLSGLDDVALVAGGIGQTPFLAYVRELLGGRGYASRPSKRQVGRVRLYYGVRNADLAAGVDDFRAAGADVHLSSDDGSVGYQGFVTQLLATHPPPERLVGCGPEPMLHAVSKQARACGVPCDVSLETPMACGLGICFSCVTKLRTADGWDYKRVCVDGPVFDAAGLEW